MALDSLFVLRDLRDHCAHERNAYSNYYSKGALYRDLLVTKAQLKVDALDYAIKVIEELNAARSSQPATQSRNAGQLDRSIAAVPAAPVSFSDVWIEPDWVEQSREVFNRRVHEELGITKNVPVVVAWPDRAAE